MSLRSDPYKANEFVSKFVNQLVDSLGLLLEKYRAQKASYQIAREGLIRVR